MTTKLQRVCTILCLTFFLLTNNPLAAQSKTIDSIEATSKNLPRDTILVLRFLDISKAYSSTNKYDSCLFYAHKSLQLSRKIQYNKGIALSNYRIAYILNTLGNNAQALTLYLGSLKMFEQLKDDESISATLGDVAYLYHDMNDNNRAFEYAQKKYIKSTAMNDSASLYEVTWSMGYFLCELNLPDSALPFFQENYRITNKVILHATVDKQNYYLGSAYSGLGLVNTYLNNTDIALPYLYKSVACLDRNADDYNLIYTYGFLAKLFQRTGHRDSCITYLNKELAIADKFQVIKKKMDIYSLLANLYADHDAPIAVNYFKLQAAMRDSMYNSRQTREIQILTEDEQQRLKDVAAREHEEAETRSRNIQYAAIAIAIIVLLVLFLLLSRSILVHEKVVEFLGVIGLLILFEFLSLVLDPLIGTLTNHSPVFMLLGLVGIAAILVPIHHQVENFITHKLTEKNKKLRLAAAKRTIERLEKRTPGKE